jgi:hypothetical protein
MPKPISITTEVERIRASSGAAHRFAVRAGARSDHDRECMDLAILRLNGLVSTCAELNRQLAELEREALEIAIMLAIK